jgi:hypothetical protein
MYGYPAYGGGPPSRVGIGPILTTTTMTTVGNTTRVTGTTTITMTTTIGTTTTITASLLTGSG